MPNQPSAFWGLETQWIDDVTELEGSELKQLRMASESTAVGALQALGGGIIEGLEVTANATAGFDVTAGACIVLSDDYGAVFLQSPVDVEGIDADDGTIYLHAQILIAGAADSRRDRGISFVPSTSASIENALALAVGTVTVGVVSNITLLAPPVRGVKWRGDWDGVRAFSIGDIVRHSSGLWLSIVPSTNSEPTDANPNWASMGVGGGGASILFGDGVPDNADGENGWVYIDNETGDYYKKLSGAWALQFNAQGPQGETGTSFLNGVGAPSNSDGADGDGYLDTVTYNVYSKASGAWSLVGNIKGDTGPAGADGADGADGAAGGTWNWIEAGWTTATAFAEDDALAHGSPAGTYRCDVAHTSGASTEPGVGADWATVWTLVAAPGANGEDGNTLLSGSGTPSNSLGADGDWYFDYTNLLFYEKVTGSYVVRASVTIPTDRLTRGSTSTVSIGTGPKTLNVGSANFGPGQPVTIAYNSDPTNQRMFGYITSYSNPNVTVNVVDAVGSGTYAVWTVSVVGLPGEDGTGGGSGESNALPIEQTAHGFAVGDWARHNGTAYVKALADGDGNAKALGQVSEVADADNFTLTMSGNVSGLSGLTPGATYYLSPTTPGAMTVTEPSTEGQVVKPLFEATSATGGVVQIGDGRVVGAVADIGTAAGYDAPAAGDAAADEVVLGSDTRLSDARTPTAHTHTLSAITDAGTAASKNVGTASTDVAAGNRGLPSGGTTGYTLCKNTGTDYDVSWVAGTLERLLNGDYWRAEYNWAGTTFIPNNAVFGTNASANPSTTASPTLLRPGGTLSTGTAAGKAGYSVLPYNTLNGGLYLASFSWLDSRIKFSIPTLSDGAVPFTLYVGFTGRSAVNDAIGVGAYFRVNGSTLEAVCHNGTTETAATWGTALVAGTIYLLRLYYTPTAVEFYVNGTLVSTISTTLPPTTTTGRLEAYVTSTSTTSRSVYVSRWNSLAKFTDATY